MGFLMSQESAVIWRGLMVMQAIQRLLFEVDWGPTDVLFVDTPPGTGDTHLTLIQHLLISGNTFLICFRFRVLLVLMPSILYKTPSENCFSCEGHVNVKLLTF